MRPLLLQNLQSRSDVNGERKQDQCAYLHKCEVQFVDVCLLLSQRSLIGCDFHRNADNKVPDTYKFS